MRLANKVLLVTLAVVVMSATALSQKLRPETDPRNQSPSVGTGGPEGGPTGLFTIYDGDTIRKGEFTFSVAYSTFDRDPGDLKITEVPLSFNIGLSDHLELFFKLNAHRKVTADSPLNLSSFYLPNVAAPFGGSLPANVLAPSVTNLSGLAGQTMFRPAFNQPFVAFPFTGGSAGTFGMGPGGILFGCPATAPCVFTLGPPSGGNFPGVGTAAGGILPGIVLATTTLPATALTLPITVPTSFTTIPSYNPEAPFLGTTDGRSSFTNISFGAKLRFTGPNNPLGVGLVAFWRWYLDRPENNFADMQEGSGPGGNKGDVGFVGFVSGRLSRSVNLSANVGYIFTTDPKANIGGTDFVLLKRPDEFIAGVGFDFPINKHFQPIAELRSTQYVREHTPNAFPNDPVEFLVGAKVYARRSIGFGFWYRRQLNQQSEKSFNPGTSSNTQINQLSGVNVPGRGIVIVPGTTVAATANGLPLGFRFSDNPNGFGFQFFAGRRNKREPSILPNQPPTASLAASVSTITLPCPPDMISATCPTAATASVQLTTTASDPDGDTLLYSYTVTGGRVTGEGANVSWDLSGLGPGTYTASVDVDDGCGCITSSTTTVTVAACTDCKPKLVCPTVNVTCPSEVDEGGSITFTANFTQGTPEVTPTYNWTVSAGTITSGPGTSSIMVGTNGLGGQTVTATVEVGGVDPSCPRTASCSTPVKPKVVPPHKFDEYGNIRFNDEKARLDNFAIQLQNEPTAQGYIIGYGSCDAEGQTRANRAKDYLVNTRGIDAGRIMVVDGGCMPELKVELWIVPQGATPPAADTTGAVSPCPDCKKKPATRRRGRRGEE